MHGHVGVLAVVVVGLQFVFGASLRVVLVASLRDRHRVLRCRIPVLRGGRVYLGPA